MMLTRGELKEVETEFERHWEGQGTNYSTAKEKQQAETAFNRVYVRLITMRKERDAAFVSGQNHCNDIVKYFDVAREGYRLLELLSNGTGDQEQWDTHTKTFLEDNKQAFEVKNENL